MHATCYYVARQRAAAILDRLLPGSKTKPKVGQKNRRFPSKVLQLLASDWLHRRRVRLELRDRNV
jgi:hypothetical protein